jgi:hypothetical protein
MPSRTFIGRLRLPTQQDAVAELQVGSPTIPDDWVDERQWLSRRTSTFPLHPLQVTKAV